MMKRLFVYILSIAAFMIIAILLFIIYNNNTTANVSDINKHMNIDQIKLGMTEEEAIRLWGVGEFQEGFGGHRREYKDRMTVLGFAGDQDNDLFNKVSSIDSNNPEYSLFDIRIGDSVLEGSEILKKHGFNIDRDIFVKDEFTVSIRGGNEINQIQIWFNDKDLKDRQY
jgi:hypothetical protein